ncbi:MAG: hypothetical protein IKG18_07285 [Atopobiaceae bacterium]|nr:hypothetical protein [Atopobiaceae bacterium]
MSAWLARDTRELDDAQVDAAAGDGELPHCKPTYADKLRRVLSADAYGSKRMPSTREGPTMRIWCDAYDNLITDEQLIRHIATFGSLSRALEAGDIRLVVSCDGGREPVEDGREPGRRRPHAALSTFL